jgi:hypothetical protein
MGYDRICHRLDGVGPLPGADDMKPTTPFIWPVSIPSHASRHAKRRIASRVLSSLIVANVVIWGYNLYMYLTIWGVK